MMNATLRPGSLRASAVKKDIPILLYEAGEALRFDEFAIRAGVKGVLNVMKHLGMIAPGRVPKNRRKARSSHVPAIGCVPRTAVFSGHWSRMATGYRKTKPCSV